MFHDLVSGSEGCQRHKWTFELRRIVQLARARDAQVAKEGKAVPKVLDLSAVVFHESRCGSTLVANTLIGMAPEKHRTYSESAPPAMAIKNVCGSDYTMCSLDQAAMVLRDSMYLMSRSNDPREERVFFKMQSITTQNIAVFQKAYPEVPWMFVYRSPVEVMMSHFKDGIHHANCVRGQQSPPKVVREIAARRGYASAESMQAEDYCAAHLASITESAVTALKASNNGIPINYATLPDILYEEVLPNIGIPVGPEEIDRIKAVSGKYSKGRGQRAGEFKGDSEQKKDAASPVVKQASATFLQESFDILEAYATSAGVAGLDDNDGDGNV
jgi:hypothetical protein